MPRFELNDRFSRQLRDVCFFFLSVYRKYIRGHIFQDQYKNYVEIIVDMTLWDLGNAGTRYMASSRRYANRQLTSHALKMQTFMSQKS